MWCKLTLPIFMNIASKFTVLVFQGKRPNDPEYVSNEALRAMCENVLQLLSNTVENMDVVRDFVVLLLVVFINYEAYTYNMAHYSFQ